MLSVRDAIDKVLSFNVNLNKIKVPIIESLAKILAEDVIANQDIPMFDNSAMDGFAVKAIDIIGADKNYPIKLKLIKEDLPAGKIPAFTLDLGNAVQIMTGAPLPSGCDCVVPKEDTLKEGENVLIFKEYKTGDNIRQKGEDIKEGQIVLKSGKKIFPADIGVMASLGIENILIYKPPTVGILPTGDEIIPINQPLTIGKVRDSNSYSLSAQIKESGAYFIRYDIAKDEKSLIKNKVLLGLKECDILLLTGGVSVGEYDYVKEILNEIGAEFVFWKVNQRPGKPIAFLTYKDKFIFALPGNPVSVMVCFELYVRPLIKKFMGEKNLFKARIKAKAYSDYKHKEGRTDFVRVKLEKVGNELYFQPTGLQGSGILTSMANADGLAIFAEEASVIKKDDVVEVILLKE